MSNDTQSYNGHDAPPASAKPRKMNLALAELFSDMADEVNEAFPPSLDPKSTEHLLNYEAQRIAINTLESVLTMFDSVDPPSEKAEDIAAFRSQFRAFRTMVFSYIVKAKALTDLDASHDVTVKHAVNRAGQDYKPEVPESKQRNGKAKKAAAAKGKEPGK